MKARTLALCAKALFVAAVIGASASSARADLEISLNESASDVKAGKFVYDVTFNNSTSASGPVQRLENGNFITLYDIQGFISASVNATFSSLFNVSTQAIGPTPGFVTPIDTALPNVDLTYKGAQSTTDAFFSEALTIYSSLTAINPNGQYTSQVTKHSGINKGSPVGAVGPVAVPVAAVPEPTAIVGALAGIPCMGALVGLVRRRRAAVTA